MSLKKPRTYELALIFAPTLSDDEYGDTVEEIEKQIEESGAEITKRESWGERSLAYPIDEHTEGRYLILYVRAEEEAPHWSALENRMNQSDRVLRYLTVRTDQDIRRALRKGRHHVEAAAAVGLGPEEPPAESGERTRRGEGRETGSERKEVS